MYPDTECKTTYVLLAAKTAAVILLKAFSFPEPSLTPSSLPSNKFFLKTVEAGQRGRAGTPPICHSASSWRFKRRQRCLLGNIPADTGARTRTGQCSARSIFTPSHASVARAAGHAQPTAPAARPGVIPLAFAAQDRQPPSASLSESGQCDFHSEFSSNFIE